MLKTAITAAKLAGEIIEKYFDTLQSFETKGGNKKDLVTVADREAEDIIKKTIVQKFPTHGFWGEETGQTDIDNEYVWIVDPLDGTTNFVHHIPLYSVSIALMRNQEIILGVVYIPKTNEMFTAEKGQGAYCNEEKISVSKTNTLSEAICSVEYYSKTNDHIDKGLEEFNYFAKKTGKIRYLSSTVFELCRVAKGNLDFCIMDTFFLDLAAAKLLVEEAGGVCALKSGGKITPHTDKKVMRIFASNSTLSSKIIKQK